MKPVPAFLLFFFQLSFSQCIKPASVKVLPVFFVATDAHPPTDSQKTDLMRHVKWAQSRYLELLGNRSTFAIADSTPLVYTSTHNTDYYDKNGAADNFASELMDYLGCNRYDCPYVFLAVFMSDTRDFPGGGARPFNGGYNTGGGVVQISSYALSRLPNFQSTLQHELGHSFGLPHVDVYGYSMDTNMSIMSYNGKHTTNWFTPSPTPGIMIPEDIRGLALNDLAFPNLEFDPKKEIPSGYTIYDIIALGIEEIPGHPYVTVSTPAVSQFGTKIGNTLYNIPTAPQDGYTLRVDLCWLSDSLTNGWAEFVYNFTEPVLLDGVFFHSAFGPDPYFYDADSAKVYRDSSGTYVHVLTAKVDAVDKYLSFTAIRTQKMKVRLRGKNGGNVCLRGIRFFYKGDDLFPPYIPYISRDPDAKLYPAAVHSLVPANNASVRNQPKVDLVWNKSAASLRYRLHIDTTEKFCSPAEIEISDTTCRFGPASAATTYYWRVRGLNNFNYGAGEWSEIRRFTIENTVAVEGKKHSGSPMLSIVRFQDRIDCAIEILAPAKVSVRVYTVQGKQVASLFDGVLNQGIHRCRWKIPSFGHGVYVLRLNTGAARAESVLVLSRISDRR